MSFEILSKLRHYPDPAFGPRLLGLKGAWNDFYSGAMSRLRRLVLSDRILFPTGARVVEPEKRPRLVIDRVPLPADEAVRV